MRHSIHDRPFSVTSEDSLRASETQNHLGDRRSECMKLNCACVIDTMNLHTLSAACALVLSSYIIAGYMCFVKL